MNLSQSEALREAIEKILEKENIRDNFYISVTNGVVDIDNRNLRDIEDGDLDDY